MNRNGAGPEFTKKKFLSLPPERRHKKCADLLKRAYEDLLSGKDIQSILEYYHTLDDWMAGPGTLLPDPTSLSDRYHLHLHEARSFLREHNLLPRVTKDDRDNSEEILPISIYLDNIRSAHNVGSILRTVEAMALGKIFFSPNTPFIDNKQVRDASMGMHLHVECIKTDSIEALPKPIIAMETSPDAVSIYEYIFPESFTLIMGNEEYGCSENTMKAADELITIPLRGRKNSLNVANAFSIAAYEIARQRKGICL